MRSYQPTQLKLEQYLRLESSPCACACVHAPKTYDNAMQSYIMSKAVLPTEPDREDATSSGTSSI